MGSVEPTTFDIQLPSGRLHAQQWGDPGAPLVLCVHGLSANMHGFDAIGPAVAQRGRRAVAIDLRGRGRSDVTPPGTYGPQRHIDDVIAVADELGAETFDWVGWSMGALLGILAAAGAPDRVRTLALLDAGGRVDEDALEAVRNAIVRLDAVVDDPEQYIAPLRDAGVIRPWGSFWETYFRYELAPTPDGRWSATTSRAASLEDLEAMDYEAVRSAWARLSMPTLLVRCTVPLGGGLLIPDAELQDMRDAIGDLSVLEVDRNHYGLMDDPRVIEAVTSFVSAAENVSSVPSGTEWAK